MLSQVLTREIVYSTQFLDTPRVKGVIKSAKVQATKRCKHNSAESVCASVWELRRVVDAKHPIIPTRRAHAYVCSYSYCVSDVRLKLLMCVCSRIVNQYKP